eukprot:2499108-Amphidinium_carterae.2
MTGEHTTPIPQPLFELRSPTQPNLRQRPGTIRQEWHNQPPDQPSYDEDLDQKTEIPTRAKTEATRSSTANQPPPGLQQVPEMSEMTTAPSEPILRTTQATTEKQPEQEPPQTTQITPPKPEVRRRITTKTTSSKNDLLATINTGVLHLSTNGAVLLGSSLPQNPYQPAIASSWTRQFPLLTGFLHEAIAAVPCS